MEEFILKNRKKILAGLAVLLFLGAVGASSLTPFSNTPFTSFSIPAMAATSEIAVTAIVQEWIAFTITESSTTLVPDLVDIGGVEAIGSSSAITLSVGTNTTTGWNITLAGAGAGLVSGGNTIASVEPTSTIAAGTAGYGVNATATLAGVNISATYDFYAGTDVGRANSTSTEIADKASANTTQSVVNMRIYAAAPASQVQGSYTDTITLTATTGT